VIPRFVNFGKFTHLNDMVARYEMARSDRAESSAPAAPVAARLASRTVDAGTTE